MKLREYPLKSKGMEIPGNVKITVRERGKIVPQHCRYNHNIWVNEGREYLARVIAPDVAQTDHFNEPPNEFVKYMGVGIGGDSQQHSAAYAAPLSVDYPPANPLGVPGTTGNVFSDDDVTVAYLERPVRIYLAGNVWMDNVAAPTFLSSNRTVRFDHLFDLTDINNASGSPYAIVPLSEVGLFLAEQDVDPALVYDGTNPPTYVGAGRQTLVAYNTFEPIPKTTSFSLEIQWEIRF